MTGNATVLRWQWGWGQAPVASVMGTAWGLGTMNPTCVAFDLTPNRLSSIGAYSKSAGHEATRKVLQEAGWEWDIAWRCSWQDDEQVIGNRREVEDAETLDRDEVCLFHAERVKRGPEHVLYTAHTTWVLSWCLNVRPTEDIPVKDRMHNRLPTQGRGALWNGENTQSSWMES